MAKKEKIVCSSCGLSKEPTRDYYSSTSPFHKHTGRLHVCKDCFWNYIEDDVEKFKNGLRMIDKPYLSELFKSSIEEAERQGRHALKIYMKNVMMPQYRGFTWADSEFAQNDVEFQIKENKDTEVSLSIDLSHLEKKWGKYNDKDLEYLENFYIEYSHSYATDTPVQINLYRNLAKVHLQAEKELSEGNIKAFKDLMELSSKLHNDGNIKPIQSTGANDDKGLSTYGLWIKTIEMDEPCEHFEDKPIYEDYDKFKKYIDQWFVRPFKNIFNISKDFNVKDDD